MTTRPEAPAGVDDAAVRAVLAAMGSMPYVSVLVVDTAMRYQAVLGAAVRRHGYDPALLLGRPVEEALPPEAFVRIGPSFRRALGGETFVQVTGSADGAADYETDYGPVVEDGEVIGAVAVVRDVTVEQRAVAELAASDERHRTLIENISDVVVLTTPDGRISWVSPSVEQVLRWTAEDLLGRSVSDHVHPDDVAEVTARRAALLDGGAPVLLTVRLRRPGGDWAWVECHVRAIRAAGTAAVDGFVVTARDVTERRRLEAELAEALETFELSFAAAPIGKALVAPDGTLIRVNTALCALLGRDEPTLLALTIRDLTHPDDLDADLDLLAETAAGEREGYRLEKRYVRPDGAVVWTLLAVSVVRDTEGRPRFYIAQIEDITTRKTALREMERLATTDPLTGLPDRLLLMDRLRHALSLARRGGGLVGVISVGLDAFKQVNDRFGHDAGDELLRRTAERITSAARDGDTTMRLGGDEFVVVCEQVSALDDVTRIAERVRAELHRPFEVLGHDLRVTAGIGVTAGRNTTAEALLQEADRTMHSAKRGSPGRIDVYTEALEVVAHDQLGLHAALAEGIARGELVVHYQPIVHLATGAVVAREALVRWQHPRLGLLPPSAFLDGTDRSGLGAQVGEHVLARACGEAAAWGRDTAVHVNISARHLAQPQFPGVVRDCLAAAGLAPERLVLEISEGMVLAASGSTLASAQALAALGVGLSLDDFGSGHSSIAALHRLPIDSFTIDRSFIADVIDNPTSAALVEGLISLGSHMDLDVIAEGIETAEQADWLAGRGCPHGQGFLFGRPAAL